MDTYLWRFDMQTLFQVVPRIDTMTCFTTKNIGNGPLVSILPDLSSWSFKGTKSLDKITCDVWQQRVTNFNKTAVYTMYLNSKTLEPVELVLDGYDFIFSSHPDVYVMKFESFVANITNVNVFDIPSLCNSSSKEANIHRARAVLGQIASLTPPQEISHPFDIFVSQHKKVYKDKQEYEYRRTIFENNMKYIEQHNSKKGVTFQMAMNHLGDFTLDEVRGLLYPKQNVDRSLVNAGATKYHQNSGSVLPNEVDWVKEGAVTRVKDQGVCGSCWTFGTTGSIEGAYFVKYHKLVSLSEQQIVDCAWGEWVVGNSGCDGGFTGPAYEWIIENGGIALEETYKYLMMDHWCNAYDKSSGVALTGYVNVTSGSEEDLQDAIASAGPVAVAIDASHPSLTFYSSGIYYEPDCKNDINDLDHEVLAVGYGTNKEGQDYWLVKNSWSTHWGNKGYVKMARNKNNNCGIATQATYPIVL